MANQGARHATGAELGQAGGGSPPRAPPNVKPSVSGTAPTPPAQQLSRGSAPNGKPLPGSSPGRGISIAALRLRVGVLRPAHGDPAGLTKRLRSGGTSCSAWALDFAAMLP